MSQLTYANPPKTEFLIKRTLDKQVVLIGKFISFRNKLNLDIATKI